MIRTIKMSDVFYDAAGNLNGIDDYSCIAVQNSLDSVFRKTGWIDCGLSAYWFGTKENHKKQKFKMYNIEDKAFWHVMDFIYEMGLKTGMNASGFNSNKNPQGARFMWLQFLALAAEDENFVLEFHSGKNAFAEKYAAKLVVKRNNKNVATYTN